MLSLDVGPTPRHVHTLLTPSDTRFSWTPVFSWTPRSGRSSGAGTTRVRTRPGCARCSCWFPRRRCPPGSKRRSSHRPAVRRSRPGEETVLFSRLLHSLLLQLVYITEVKQAATVSMYHHNVSMTTWQEDTPEAPAQIMASVILF